MAHIAIDVDGTIGATPYQMQEIASALMAAGHRVTVLTGYGDGQVTQAIFDEKANYLNSLGFGQSYNDMTVIANGPGVDLAAKKADYCVSEGVDILIDNSKANAKAAVAAGVPLVLVPWASRVDGG